VATYHMAKWHISMSVIYVNCMVWRKKTIARMLYVVTPGGANQTNIGTVIYINCCQYYYSNLQTGNSWLSTNVDTRNSLRWQYGILKPSNIYSI